MADGILNPVEQLEAEFDFDVYTKQEVDTLLDEKADKADTYTKTETDALLNEKADVATTYTKTETDTLLSAKADKSTTLAGYGITDAYTKTETDNLLNGKADTNNVYTKEETDNLLSAKANSTDVYTKTETNNLLSAKADSINVYTKTEADTLLAGKADTDDVYTKTEIDNQLTVTKDGTWVKGTQTTATNLEKLEGGIEYLYGLLSYKYSQLRKYINGNYYDYETNTDSAYTKTVPAGAMPYAGLEQLGGKTLVWNQLEKSDATTETVSGVTFTNNSGEWTVNGTATASITKNVGLGNVSLIQGHKYILRGCPSGGSDASYKLGLASVTTDYGSGALFTWSNASNVSRIRIMVASGYDASDLVFRPQFIDLTLMFGSGNEPTTVEQFREMFPADYYEYNSGELLSAGVTEVVSKKADTTTIATYSVPAEIQSLEGYGWSAGSVYNYIDYERKVFVQNVFRATFNGTTDGVFAGGVSIGQSGTNNPILSFRLPSNSPYVHKTENNYTLHNAICDSCPQATYNQVSYNQAETGAKTTSFAVQGNWNVGFAFYVPSLSTLAEYQTYLASNPLTLQWELATPIEIDISQYLTDDNLIEVEAGGTLTFPNSNGDNYRIPVPSTEEYIIDLQEAVSNG